MGIFYIFTILILTFAFLIFKKTNSKLNLTTWLIISIISLICYQVFICYILNLINIKCTLSNLGFINSIIGILLIIYSVIKSKYQKYFINKKDIIVAILLMIIVAIICKVNYKSFDDIKYDTTDPANHFMASLEFYRNSTLLNKIPQNEIYDYATMMPASYVNTGILFKIQSTINNSEIEFYKMYILMDCIMLYLSSITFYLLIKKYFRKGEKLIVGFLITLLFTLRISINKCNIWICIFKFRINNYRRYNFVFTYFK